MPLIVSFPLFLSRYNDTIHLRFDALIDNIGYSFPYIGLALVGTNCTDDVRKRGVELESSRVMPHNYIVQSYFVSVVRVLNSVIAGNAVFCDFPFIFHALRFVCISAVSGGNAFKIIPFHTDGNELLRERKI